ncbi:MAG TPA: hypothetical protein VF572_00350 [Candidatus Saccharimonadales bacterium]|jgi:hypothetical protein
MYDTEYFLIPLEDVSTKLTLPFHICNYGGYRLSLHKFSRKDVSSFRIKIIKRHLTGSYDIVPFDVNDQIDHQQMAYSLIESSVALHLLPISDNLEPAIEDRLYFAMRRILGIYPSQASWVSSTHAKVIYRGTPSTFYCATRIRFFTSNIADELKKVFQADVINADHGQKYKTLRALYNSAIMQAGSRDVSRVLLISTLEAIYVQDNQEVAYKLSMRIAKSTDKPLTHVKRLKKLYSKRGKVIHGSYKGEVFSDDEHHLLESLTKSSLADYFAHPHKYSEDKLDALLLS